MMYRLWGAVLFDFMWMMQISYLLRIFLRGNYQRYIFLSLLVPILTLTVKISSTKCNVFKS